MPKKQRKRTKMDDSANTSSISDFLDKIVKDDESLRTLIREIYRRDEIMSQLVKPETIELMTNRIIELENEVDELQQYSRRTCLKLSGIKETPNEDTDKLILDLVNTHILPEGEERLNLNHIGRSH
ncbi:hypothetical protein SNE40_016186 [Patella caerulea]|uniref:Uncharacterized protein n=1 Tax=Patella caerulea TaxID=87958 RepID=A0AAN8J9G6_PATCE